MNTAREFSDTMAWTCRVKVFSLIISSTTEMGFGSLIFSSLMDPFYNSSQAKQGLCALVSLYASRI